MQVKASLKHLRIAPRKVRLVANLIKGLAVTEAENQLKFLGKRSVVPVAKLLKSAVANASHNFNLDKNDLYIQKITVDGGPMQKRSLPRAMGRATPIQKKTSHVTIILEDRAGSKKTSKAAKPTVAKTPVGQVAGPAAKEGQPSAKTFKTAPRREKSGLTKRTIGFGQKVFRRKAI